MDVADLQQLAEWLDEGGIRSIEIEGPRRRLRLVMEGTADEADLAGRDAAQSICSTANGTAVLANFPGIFLTTHPSRSDPFVRPIDQVRMGDIVGLLKIGRILIPVTAPCEGIVTRILVDQGTTVDFGTRLVEIQPLTGISVETSEG